MDVAFEPRLAGAGAAYDPAARTRVPPCHQRGGARPTPAWSERGPMACGACHAAPPAAHPRGACDTCHADPDATATALRPGPMHLNGRVDLGDGSGTCTACHGRAGDAEPWPASGAHAAHRSPSGGPVACASCHVVPSRPDDPAHFEAAPRASVHLGGAASARGSTPRYDAATRACADVACHGAGLGGAAAEAPRWDDASASRGDAVSATGCRRRRRTRRGRTALRWSATAARWP